MQEELTLKIPGEVVAAAKLPPDEVENGFRVELAIALYGRGILPAGKACMLAQMTRGEFEEMLGRRKITRHYTEAGLDEDLHYARGHQ